MITKFVRGVDILKLLHANWHKMSYLTQIDYFLNFSLFWLPLLLLIRDIIQMHLLKQNTRTTGLIKKWKDITVLQFSFMTSGGA